MKKSTLLLFAFCVFLTSSAQKFQILTSSVSDSFFVRYSMAKTTETDYAKLYLTAKDFFQTDNKTFNHVYENLRKQYHLSGDSASRVIFDSIMYRFLKVYMWEGHSALKQKTIDPLNRYAVLVCACSYKASDESGNEAKEVIENCIQSVNGDPAFLDIAKELGTRLTSDEQTTVANLVPFHLMAECNKVYDYLAGVVYSETCWSYVLEHERLMREKTEEIVKQYNTKSGALNICFPDYKKYESAIKQAATVLKKDDLQAKTEILTIENKFTVFRTYYNYVNEKAVLFGQVSYTLKEESIYAPVTSFKFITSDKIPMKESIVKWLNSMYVEPPPPLLLK